MTQSQSQLKLPQLVEQAGITNRPPQHLLLAALQLTGDAKVAIEALRSVVQKELTSDLDPAADPAGVADETGELGFTDHYDRSHLTITLGLASSAYDKLGVPPTDRPQDLTPVPWSALGDEPENAESGDVLLQICADSAYITEHVLRRIEVELAGGVQVVWAHTGVQRYTSRAGRTAREEGRAWIGFHDGLSNLNPRRDPDDRALVFVDPDPAVVATYPKTPPSGQPGPYGPGNQPQFPQNPPLREHPGSEPESTRNGTYMAVRISAQDLHTWDDLALATQEQTVGRRKTDGVALDLDDTQKPDTPPAFASNQADVSIAVNAHIRKANPRTPDDADRRIFRRGYPLYEGSGSGLRRGLIFICYARTLSTQFEFITRGWLNNADFPHPQAGVDLLRQYDPSVLAGGYYFVPPLEQARHPWSWHIPAGF